MSHGLTNSRQDAPLFAELENALTQDGFGVVSFDYFGSGKSDGVFRDKTLSTLRRNLSDVLEDLPTRLGPGVEVGLFGRSIGATLCGYFLSKPIVRCAVLASPPVDLEEAFGSMRCEDDGDVTQLPAATHPPSGQLKGEYCLGEQFFAELPGLTADFEVAVNGSERILVIYGAADEKVVPMHMERLVSMLGADSDYVEVPDAGHNYLGFEATAVNSAADWFRRHLKRVP